MQEEALKERADLRDVTVKTEVTGASLSAPDFSAQPIATRNAPNFIQQTTKAMRRSAD
jgi:hypothetical protein